MVAYVSLLKVSSTRNVGLILNCKTQNAFGWKYSLTIKKLLIGTFYRSPSSSNDALIAIENSIGLANDTNIHDILITGDFNLDIPNPNTWSKINNLFQYFGLEQLIKEPTHYTESSSSTIDLFLTSYSNNVFLTGVGDPF